MRFHTNVAPFRTPYDFVASVAVYEFRTNVAAFYFFSTSGSKARCFSLFLVQFRTNVPALLVSRTIWCQELLFLAVSGTNSCQRDDTYSRDRGSGGTRFKNVPRDTRSALVFNEKFRLLSHGDVTCHRPWTFPLVSQDLKI